MNFLDALRIDAGKSDHLVRGNAASLEAAFREFRTQVSGVMVGLNLGSERGETDEPGDRRRAPADPLSAAACTGAPGRG